MLQTNIVVEAEAFALQEVHHSLHSFEAIRTQTKVLLTALTRLGVNRDDAVAIYNENNFQNICAIYACLLYGANFTVIDSNDSEDVWLVKKPLLGVDLLISDFYKDNYIVTFNPVNYRTNLNCGAVGTLDEKSLSNFRKLTSELHFELNAASTEFVDELPNLDIRKLEQRTCAVYHKGATEDAFKTSFFTLDRLVTGIERSTKRLKYEGDKVLFMETFDLMYDIVNGVINPLSNGKLVLFANTNSYEVLIHSCMSLRATDMYVNAFTLEKVLNLLEEDLPDYIRRFKGDLLFGWIFKLYIRKKFQEVFGKQLKHLVITGKIRKPELINSLGLRITTLYTMTEVASFVTCKSHKKLKKNYSVGKIDTEEVQIVGKRVNNYGGIILFAPDMAISCFPEETRSESYVGHRFKGRLWTKDIGYIDDEGELHVIDKSNLIFEMDNGKLVMTGEMLEIALSKRFVREALIVKPLGDSRRLVMLIEPNTDYAEEHGLTYEMLQFKCNELRLYINKRFKGDIPLTGVVLYTHPDGITRDTFKIVSRRLG